MTKTSFITAFIEAQKEMEEANKDSQNPYFKSSYADLSSVQDACIPALNKNGIAVMQPIVQKEGKNYVRTIFLHTSGESIESDVEIIFYKTTDAQAQGSGITYARRYGLQSLACLKTTDDDGNKATEGNDNNKGQEKPKVTPKPENDEEMFDLLVNTISSKKTIADLSKLLDHPKTKKAIQNLREDYRIELEKKIREIQSGF